MANLIEDTQEIDQPEVSPCVEGPWRDSITRMHTDHGILAGVCDDKTNVNVAWVSLKIKNFQSVRSLINGAPLMRDALLALKDDPLWTGLPRDLRDRIDHALRVTQNQTEAPSWHRYRDLKHGNYKWSEE